MKISKTTKQNIRALEQVLDDIMAVESFIKSDLTFVCRRSNGRTSAEYQHKNAKAFDMPEHVRPINKLCGSELCYLFNARQKLQLFIQNANQQTPKDTTTNNCRN